MNQSEQVTIIYAHPWDGSFNQAELTTVKKRLDERKQPYTVINLNADGFNPVMTQSDLSVYGRGDYKDPQVAKYIEIIKKTDKIILLFPLWWAGMPAILKGFFDKVFLMNRIVNFVDRKAVSHTNVTGALVLTTSQLSNEEMAVGFDGAIERVVNYPLASVGAKQITWHNQGDILMKDRPALAAYLEKIPGFVDDLLN
ncbi:NAD(P)H-dependent oxidoreductase [Furfurilactobacillus entadae]|uniref:NAD(P)H-dependent oxidoreductase n=1 Tax=Furfurilactobacillus entadae TaxID=2922307 RepID=UPI0035EF7944